MTNKTTRAKFLWSADYSGLIQKSHILIIKFLSWQIFIYFLTRMKQGVKVGKK